MEIFPNQDGILIQLYLLRSKRLSISKLVNQMKSIGRYFVTATMFAVLASSCKDMLNPEEIKKANPGDEVVFGGAIPGK